MKMYVTGGHILDVDMEKLRQGDEYVYPCGCRLPCSPDQPLIHGQHYPIDYDPETISLECEATWELVAEGLTKGVFQLESRLGRTWAKKLGPEHLEHLSGLIALLRPGCVSGDTLVAEKLYGREKRRYSPKTVTLREYYEKYSRNHAHYEASVVSVNEESFTLFNNQLLHVTYMGQKEVFRPRIRVRLSRWCDNSTKFHLECTADHKLLSLTRGWVELQELRPGERIAVMNPTKEKSKSEKYVAGKSNFSDICFQNYQYKCVLCDWGEGRLDVNHLEGNRFSNNDPDNLCFLCPNHHRMYGEGNISAYHIRELREPLRLPNTPNIFWAEFIGSEYLGVKDTYDIGVVGPHHNFIAGNFVVHNCLQAKDERGISMTELYCLRKKGVEDITYPIEATRPLLENTFGVMCYQESLMKMAQVLAGFNLGEIDKLRKAAGKKDQSLMNEIGKLFVSKATDLGVITHDEAVTMFENMKKSGRYLFNHSHSISYALNTYRTAHWKVHAPIYFFTSYLYWAKEKQDPIKEMRQLINDARYFDIRVRPPHFPSLSAHFSTNGTDIEYGLGNVKGLGAAVITKMVHSAQRIESTLGHAVQDWSWYQFLIHFANHAGAIATRRMAEVGALDYLGIPRQRMLAEFEAWNRLTETEQTRVLELEQTIYATKRKKIEGKFVQVEQTDADGNRLVLQSPMAISSLEQALTTILERAGAVTKARRDKVASILQMLRHPPTRLIDTPHWIAKMEEEYLGIALTAEPMSQGDHSLINCTLKDYLAGWSPAHKEDLIVLGVRIEEVFEREVKNGENRGRKMANLVISDRTGVFEDVVVFPDAWENLGTSLSRQQTTLALGGKRTWRPGEQTLIVEAVWEL